MPFPRRFFLAANPTPCLLAWAAVFIYCDRPHVGVRGLTLGYHGLEGLERCLKDYADDLDRAQPGLGRRIRGYPLRAAGVSPREVVFAAGPGTAGTSSLAAALSKMGLATAHHIELAPAGYLEWQDSVARCWSANSTDDECLECFRTFNYTTLPEEVDAAVDLPIPNVFIDLFLSFPNAQWLLNTRPSREFAESRMGKYPDSATPIQHPCSSDILRLSSVEGVARLLDLHNDLVRCVVPPERLFEFDIFTDGAHGLMHDLSVFLERPETCSMDEPYPNVTCHDLAQESE